MLAGRLRSPLPVVLAVIFAAFHLIVVGGMILESPQGGEGFAYAFIAYEWPLLLLCLHVPVFGQYLCHGVSGNHYSVVLVTGTVVYALIGFGIGAAIIRIRALLASRWD